MTLVLPADVVSYLVPYLRDRLGDYFEGVSVGDSEPDASETWPDLLVVIRHVTNSATSVITEEVTVSASVYAGSREDPDTALDIARYVYALLRATPGLEDGNPIAAVTESLGPYLATDQQATSLAYQTHTLSVVGTPI